jgi:L-fucose isomerase-like protein
VRLFIQRGRAVPMDKELMGTYAKVVFEQAVEKVLDSILANGVAHHFALIYGDQIRAFKLFAKMMGYQLID